MANKAAMQAIKAECAEMMKQWPKEITCVKKGVKGSPFPVEVTRTIPQPKACSMWDVYNLKVRLIIDGKDKSELPVRVEIPKQGQGNGMHIDVREAIEDELEEKWKKALEILTTNSSSGWAMSRIFQYAEESYDSLLRLIPELVEVEMGYDPNTMRECRRWNIKSDEIQEEEIELTEEQIMKNELRRIRRERKAAEAEEAKMKEDDEKRRLAESGLVTKVQVVHQKKQTRKERSGVRTAKTGSRCTKYDPTAEKNKK